MEGNEVDKLEHGCIYKASGERKVLIERKSHVFCYVVQVRLSAQDPIFPEVDYWLGIPH